MPEFRDFDELYVISDLHIGGRKDFQIFDQGELLGRLLDHVRLRPAKKKVALLINGDTVDFLAESPFMYIDPAGAVAKLDRIVGDPSFKRVWEGLAGLVRKANRHLIITLGNHDIELALPWVQERLLDLLSEGDEAARGRITLSFSGAGYVCGVGGASVLCVHGNDFDPFNFTDYEKLRAIGVDYVQRKPFEDWTPNAGTKLVIDVMNQVKQTFPFVDLLKPEDTSMLPILAELAPDLKAKLEAVWEAAKKAFWDNVKRRFRERFLGDEAADSGPVSGSFNQFLGDALPKTANRPQTRPSSDDLLFLLESDLDRDPMDLLSDTEMAEPLGRGRAIWNKLTGAKDPDVLFEALEGLRKDRRFHLDHSDKVFNRSDKDFGRNFDFVLTGHTHEERRLPLAGGGTYFNTGSWVAMMRLTDAVLGDKASFEQAFEVLKNSRTLDQLKAAKVQGKSLVLHFPGVARIDGDGGGLFRVREKGAGVALDPVTNESKLDELGEKTP